MKTEAIKVYTRGGTKLYGRVRVRVRGGWTHAPTPFVVGEEAKARKHIAELRREVARREADAAGRAAGRETVEQLAVRWADARTADGKKRMDQVRGEIVRHAVPRIGDKPADDVTPEDVMILIRDLRAAGSHAPLTIRRVYASLRAMFAWAASPEGGSVVRVNPCALTSTLDGLGKPADQRAREAKVYTRAEAAALVSDPRIPLQRRVLYAIKLLTGLRHGDAAGLRWSHYVPGAGEDLGKLTAEIAKVDTINEIPVHPVLAARLAEWREAWAEFYGREPKAEDYIVPTRAFTPIRVDNAQPDLLTDLRALGLVTKVGRTPAGRDMHRSGHDMRGWFYTALRDDGADERVASWITHPKPRDRIAGAYNPRGPAWPARCAAVARLRIPVDLAASHGQPMVNPEGGSENLNNFEPVGGYDPPTYGLRNRCSTTELHRLRR